MQQVLTVLLCLFGVEGVPTLARGTYPGWGTFFGLGLPALDGVVPTLDRVYLPWKGGIPTYLHPSQGRYPTPIDCKVGTPLIRWKVGTPSHLLEGRYPPPRGLTHKQKILPLYILHILRMRAVVKIYSFPHWKIHLVQTVFHVYPLIRLNICPKARCYLHQKLLQNAFQ